MADTTVQLIGGAFQSPTADLLANGYLLFTLNQDEQVNGNIEICAGFTVRIQLDQNGDVVVSPPQFLWPNDVMTPSGSFYIISGYSQRGELVWGPNAGLIGSPGPSDVGTIVPPSGPGGGSGGGSGLSLTTIGNSGPSTLIGTVLNVPIYDSEDILVLTTVGSSGPATLSGDVLNIPVYVTPPTIYKVNGVALAASDTINFENGSNVTITNPSAGNVQITASGGGGGGIGPGTINRIPIWISTSNIGDSLLDWGITTPNVLTSEYPNVTIDTNASGTQAVDGHVIVNCNDTTFNCIYPTAGTSHGKFIVNADSEDAIALNATNGGIRVTASSQVTITGSAIELSGTINAAGDTTISGTAQIGGSVQVPVTIVSSNYAIGSAGSGDYMVAFDATGGPITGSLPSAASNSGMIFNLKKLDSTTAHVTIVAAGADVIDGASNYVLTAQYKYVVLQSDGISHWYIFGSN